MNDTDKIMMHIELLPFGEEISDACARMIASMYHNGQSSIGYSFVSTGAIAEDDDTWRDLFGPWKNGEFQTYANADKRERRMMDMLGTYLLNREDKGPVWNWSDLWL